MLYNLVTSLYIRSCDVLYRGKVLMGESFTVSCYTEKVFLQNFTLETPTVYYKFSLRTANFRRVPQRFYCEYVGQSLPRNFHPLKLSPYKVHLCLNWLHQVTPFLGREGKESHVQERCVNWGVCMVVLIIVWSILLILGVGESIIVLPDGVSY